jgi:hypothetical protein
MELARRYCRTQESMFAAYLALQRALMHQFVAQGGTEEEFCARLAPAFRRRYGLMLEGEGSPRPAGP